MRNTIEPFEAHYMLRTRQINGVSEFGDRIEFRLAEPGDDCVLTLWRASGEWSLPDNWILGSAAKREALREASR